MVFFRDTLREFIALDLCTTYTQIVVPNYDRLDQRISALEPPYDARTPFYCNSRDEPFKLLVEPLEADRYPLYQATGKVHKSLLGGYTNKSQAPPHGFLSITLVARA